MSHWITEKIREPEAVVIASCREYIDRIRANTHRLELALQYLKSMADTRAADVPAPEPAPDTANLQSNSKTQEGLGLPVTEYDAGDGVRIEAEVQGDGSTRWAVRRGLMCLNAIGEWEYDAQPITRDPDFFYRCRYANSQLALSSLMVSRKQPNPPIDDANWQSNLRETLTAVEPKPNPTESSGIDTGDTIINNVRLWKVAYVDGDWVVRKGFLNRVPLSECKLYMKATPEIRLAVLMEVARMQPNFRRSDSEHASYERARIVAQERVRLIDELERRAGVKA